MEMFISVRATTLLRFYDACWIPPYLVAPCDQLGDAIASTGCRNVGAMISQYNCVDGARCLLPTAFKDSSVRTTASAPRCLARARFVYDYALYKFAFTIIIIIPFLSHFMLSSDAVY